MDDELVMVELQMKVTSVYDTAFRLRRDRLEEILEASEKEFPQAILGLVENISPVAKGISIESFREVDAVEIN